MLQFDEERPPEPISVSTNQEIPKEFDIFFKNEQDFLPPGKTLEDLTPEERKLLQEQYRFSPLRPGQYQSITGFRNSV